MKLTKLTEKFTVLLLHAYVDVSASTIGEVKGAGGT